MRISKTSVLQILSLVQGKLLGIDELNVQWLTRFFSGSLLSSFSCLSCIEYFIIVFNRRIKGVDFIIFESLYGHFSSNSFVFDVAPTAFDDVHSILPLIDCVFPLRFVGSI